MLVSGRYRSRFRNERFNPKIDLHLSRRSLTYQAFLH
jgi:hypothetical protein